MDGDIFSEILKERQKNKSKDQLKDWKAIERESAEGGDSERK